MGCSAQENNKLTLLEHSGDPFGAGLTPLARVLLNALHMASAGGSLPIKDAPIMVLPNPLDSK